MLRGLLRRPSTAPFPSIVSETKADAIDLDTGALPRAGVICRDAIVISCIGATVSTPVILERLNHLVPLAWAKAAQAAGARQFIHLSSISVYGAATSIDAHTPLEPVTVYGRTRLAGERALGELSDPDFPVMLLRIPALIGDGDRKVASLIRLFAAIGLVPKFAPPVTRSMLSHGALAAVIGRAISARSDGVQVAADPRAVFLRNDMRRGATPGPQIWAGPGADGHPNDDAPAVAGNAPTVVCFVHCHARNKRRRFLFRLSRGSRHRGWPARSTRRMSDCPPLLE